MPIASLPNGIELYYEVTGPETAEPVLLLMGTGSDHTMWASQVPAYSRELELGAFFGEKFGWERPNWFTPSEKEAKHGYEPRGWGRKHWSAAIEIRTPRSRAMAFQSRWRGESPGR